MAALVPTDLVVIDEEEELSADFDTIVDPVRLKYLRTGGKRAQTKSGKSLMKAIRVGDDRDTVRVNYVIHFDNLEIRHD
jgi:phage-related protein